MSNTNSLIQLLDRRLQEFGYEKEENVTVPEVEFISYVKNKGFLDVRNLCAALRVPENVNNNEGAKIFFATVRNSLLKKYGDAILWKELEICMVVFAEDNLYQALKADDGKAVDVTSFSFNSMIGSCFINLSNFEYFPHSTWGLYFSGDHFKAVNEIVKEWCKNQNGGGTV